MLRWGFRVWICVESRCRVLCQESDLDLKSIIGVGCLSHMSGSDGVESHFES